MTTISDSNTAFAALQPLDLTAAINQTIDPMRLMQRVTDRTLELIGVAEGVMVGLADAHHVAYLCGAGRQRAHAGTKVAIHSSLSGLAVLTGKLQCSPDTSKDPRVDIGVCRRLSVGSLVCVPLQRSDDTIGVLAVNAKEPDSFTDQDIALLARIADFVSAVIGSALDLERVRSNLLQLEPNTGPSSIDGSMEQRVDPATRYVMGVLSPDQVAEIDREERIRAILNDPQHLSTVYQPIVDLSVNAVTAVEALARFNIEPYQPPHLWFGDAHKSGIGVDLELLAVRRALDELGRLPRGIALTINVGPETVLTHEFQCVVAAVAPGSLIVELTEHVAIGDYSRLVDALQTLRRQGIRIAIDDAGSGYSGLGHILKLAPDFIKLDRELVNGINLDPVRRALAASLVTFASETGAAIIAEGVESQDEIDTLRFLGLQYVQGHYLSPPATIDELTLNGCWAPVR